MKIDSNDIVQFYTKIQQAQSGSNTVLSNKEVGFFVHVETDKVYKLKSCVDSQKTNADLYKKFSKDFIRNIRKGQSQMLICCGMEESTRLESSVGCKKNPGMLLITGIAILDEKYQEDFMKFDIQISFMQYVDGNLYDLLSYTKKPLKMTKWEQNIYFGQTYCKITTFSQFLKLLKIALFNNKQRDFRSESSLADKSNEEKIASTFIMTIVTKKYSNLGRSSNTIIQKNVVIDFAGSYSSGFQPDLTGGQKSVWDYFLIELNNMTCRKKLHYHLVQPNPLLSLTKCMLKTGKTYILSSFSTNPSKFQSNYKYYTDLTDTVDLVTKQIETNSQISMGSTIKTKFQSSLIEKQLSEAEMLAIVFEAAGIVQRNVKNKKYNSLRQYRDMKDKNRNIIVECLDWICSYRRLFIRMFENKRVMKLAENQILADQIKLIGNCVKSENYKQFYQAKSYLTLDREVGIKTQGSRQEILKLSKQKYELKDKFNELKTKHWQEYLKISPSINEISNIKYLICKVLDFLSKIFYGIMMCDQRTIIDEILKQESVNENLNSLCKKLTYLDDQIGEMSKNGTILFDVTDLKKDAHLSYLVKEVEDIINKQQKIKKEQRKMRNNGQQKQKQKQNMKQTETVIGKKFTKLPALSQKRVSIEITGNFEFASLLLNPNEEEWQKG